MQKFVKTLIAGVIFSLIACSSNKKMSAPQDSLINSSFDKQGHRGCRGLMPENTIPAMLKALDLGVTTLEMDVCFTKDSIAVLSHEPFLNHDITTLPDGRLIEPAKERQFNIYKMTYAELE